MKERKMLIFSILGVLLISLTGYFTKRIWVPFLAPNSTITVSNYIEGDKWFQTQYNAIQSQKKNLENDIKESEKEKTEKLKESIAAQKKIINQLISEYNAKADSVGTSFFLSQNLPQRIGYVE